MITIKTDNPSGLLNSMYAGIDNKSINTWQYDKSTKYFTHVTEQQWKYGEAWFRPAVKTDSLQLFFTAAVDKRIYSMYTGDFIYMLLYHFGDQIQSIETSAKLQLPVKQPKSKSFAEFFKSRQP